MNEKQIDKAIDEMMALIDGHKAASSDVTRQASIQFYDGIRQYCRDRAEQIRAESEAVDV